MHGHRKDCKLSIHRANVSRQKEGIKKLYRFGVANFLFFIARMVVLTIFQVKNIPCHDRDHQMITDVKRTAKLECEVHL